MKECDFFVRGWGRSKHTLTHLTYFQGVMTPLTPGSTPLPRRWLCVQCEICDITSDITAIYSLGHGLCAPFLQCLGQLSPIPYVGR